MLNPLARAALIIIIQMAQDMTTPFIALKVMKIIGMLDGG